MAAGDTDVGTGTTFTFSGFVIEILSIQHTGMSRESIDTSHMTTTGARTKMPSDLYEGGQLVIEGHFKTTLAVPITGAKATGTVTFPDLETWSATMFLSAFEWTDPLEDKMMFTATFQIADDITF